jgi:hypothetical protein
MNNRLSYLFVNYSGILPDTSTKWFDTLMGFRIGTRTQSYDFWIHNYVQRQRYRRLEHFSKLKKFFFSKRNRLLVALLLGSRRIGSRKKSSFNLRVFWYSKSSSYAQASKNFWTRTCLNGFAWAVTWNLWPQISQWSWLVVDSHFSRHDLKYGHTHWNSATYVDK